MADQISKLHTEMTVGTTQFSAGMAKASGDLGSLNNAFKGTGDNLGRLANRLDKGDIVNGFANISTALGNASGMGDKFGNFMSGFALSAATGGVAGAAFGAGIGLINLGLEEYNTRAANTIKRNEEIAASFKSAFENIKAFNLEETRADQGRGGGTQSRLEQVQDMLATGGVTVFADLDVRDRALRAQASERDPMRGALRLQEVVLQDRLQKERAAAADAAFEAGRAKRMPVYFDEARFARNQADAERETHRMQEADRPGFGETWNQFYEQADYERIRDAHEAGEVAAAAFYSEFADYDAWEAPAKKAAEKAAAWMNPAIIAGSQADVEMQARLEAEEQTDYLREIADNTKGGGLTPAVF